MVPPSSKQTRPKWFADLDIYRKVPTDLMESSAEGNVFSWFVLVCILGLLFRETLDFVTPKLMMDLSIDSSRSSTAESKMQVDFNITLLDLRCQHATINVVSVLGNEQNITKNIQRYDLDSAGIQRQLARKNPDQHDILHFDESVHESLEFLHLNGEDAASLNEETLSYALEDYEYVFVNYFAPWCSHCLKLHPTWEKFAEIMHDVVTNTSLTKDAGGLSVEEIAAYKEVDAKEHPVLVAKVDCVQNAALCANEGIMAYPSLILYVNGGRALGGSYHGHRTIKAFFQALISVEQRVNKDPDAKKSVEEHTHRALEQHFNMTKDHEEWLTAMARSKENHRIIWNPEDHPGCLITGTLHLNRVPGRFYIRANGASAGYDFDPYKTNMSHEINHLSFRQVTGDAKADQNYYRHEVRPANFDKKTCPFDGNVYANSALHESFHHYVKLVPTNTNHYQVIQSSQLSLYQDTVVPEAKFQLDFSPIAVSYRIQKRPWYDYVTTVLAIVGGTFTIFGMMGTIARAAHRRIITVPRKTIRKGPQQAKRDIHYQQQVPIAVATSYR
ncbi:hypothetical protein MPSEU_000653800 [Mayamaea pseudoterrestris]|nr:hypothetical protein MPSEU_000653800 [Mayamaea pseudoterrestris]